MGGGCAAQIAETLVLTNGLAGVSAYFYGYESVRRFLAAGSVQRRVEDLATWETMLAGGCGG
jgi:hypothetical protein